MGRHQGAFLSVGLFPLSGLVILKLREMEVGRPYPD